MRWITLAMLLVVACGVDKEDEDTGCDYQPPIADAGEDQTGAPGAAVTLDGSGSIVFCHPDLACTWALEYAPAESEVGDTAFGEHNGSSQGCVVEFIPDVPGTFLIGLWVGDGRQLSAPDYVDVEVPMP